MPYGREHNIISYPDSIEEMEEDLSILSVCRAAVSLFFFNVLDDDERARVEFNNIILVCIVIISYRAKATILDFNFRFSEMNRQMHRRNFHN